MKLILSLPFFLEAILMMVDEFHFHRARGLPRWERIGHPLDTATLLSCLAWVLWISYGTLSLAFYIGMAVFSTLFVTKDEWVHARYCKPGEHWVHSLQFTLHPILLIIAAFVWPALGGPDPYWKIFLEIQFFVILIFFFYQILYWNFLWKTPAPAPSSTTTSTTI
jgi:hypothetical protein